jgi:PAS domain S-box-containing protein
LHDSQGRITAVGGTFHDSTREASAALDAIAARERFRDIARLVSDWLWETDADFNLTYVSARAMEILGLQTHHMIGRSLFSLGTFQISDTNAKPPSLSTRSPFRNMTFAMRAANGSACLFQLSGIPVFNEARGAFVGFRGTARDITDLKAREAALTTARDMAEVANRSKGEFLANMSHELRTPLNAIIGFSEIMDRGTFGALGSERYKGYVRDIIRSSRHLLGIINDILEAAKMEAGKLDLDEEAIDVAAATQEIVQLLAEQAAQAHLAVAIKADDNLPRLHADPRRLRQILLNLISNAIKFTPSGGSVTVEIGCGGSGGITLVVADTGIGIAAEDLTKALTPFGQVEGSLNRRHDGTGLGLPLSKALAELHGAEFHIDSAPGRGTRITIAFPASRTRLS